MHCKEANPVVVLAIRLINKEVNFAGSLPFETGYSEEKMAFTICPSFDPKINTSNNNRADCTVSIRCIN